MTKPYTDEQRKRDTEAVASIAEGDGTSHARRSSASSVFNRLAVLSGVPKASHWVSLEGAPVGSSWSLAKLWVELVLRHTKDALDALGIPNRDLDMSLFSKSRSRIRRLTLGEDTLDGVDGGQLLRFENRMQSPNDGAVEVSPSLVLAVRWQTQCSSTSHVNQALVCDPHPI